MSEQADTIEAGLSQLLNRLNDPRRRAQEAEFNVESVSENLRETENAALAAAGFHNITHHPVTELQAYKDFRAGKKQLETDTLVDAIINEKTEAYGPLNPQLLLIRSLESMRELSPLYLNRFVSYIDALSRLEEAE